MNLIQAYGIALRFKEEIGENDGTKKVYDFFAREGVTDQLMRSFILDVAKKPVKQIKQLIYNKKGGNECEK